MSKFASSKVIENLIDLHLIRARGFLDSVQWTLKSGELTQMRDHDTYDLSLSYLSHGNGVSVDSGSDAQAGSTALVSKLELGMTYKGQKIIAFKIKAKCHPLPIYVYASMANLIYLEQNKVDFQIIDTLALGADLGPIVSGRLNLSTKLLEAFINTLTREFGINFLLNLNAKGLLKIQNDKTSSGQDFRNVVFVDPEEIEDQNLGHCQSLAKAWKSESFVKSYANNSSEAVSVKTYFKIQGTEKK